MNSADEILNELEKKCCNESWYQRAKERSKRKTYRSNLLDQQLYNACRFHNWSDAIVIIKSGATNDYVDPEGMTALHFATRYGQTDVMEIILDYFPEELERKRPRYQTAFGVAVAHQKFDSAKIALTRGAEHPLFQWLIGEKHGKQSLEIINTQRDLPTIVAEDLQYLQQMELDDDNGVQAGLTVLFDICSNTYNIQISEGMRDIKQTVVEDIPSRLASRDIIKKTDDSSYTGEAVFNLTMEDLADVNFHLRQLLFMIKKRRPFLNIQTHIDKCHQVLNLSSNGRRILHIAKSYFNIDGLSQQTVIKCFNTLIRFNQTLDHSELIRHVKLLIKTLHLRTKYHDYLGWYTKTNESFPAAALIGNDVSKQHLLVEKKLKQFELLFNEL